MGRTADHAGDIHFEVHTFINHYHTTGTYIHTYVHTSDRTQFCKVRSCESLYVVVCGEFLALFQATDTSLHLSELHVYMK